MFLRFCLGLRSIFNSSTQSIFFIHVHHSTDGALGPVSGCLKKSEYFHSLHASCAIVVCTLTKVPRIQVTAYDDNFVREFRTFYFTDNIKRWGIFQGLAMAFKIEL